MYSISGNEYEKTFENIRLLYYKITETIVSHYTDKQKRNKHSMCCILYNLNLKDKTVFSF